LFFLKLVLYLSNKKIEIMIDTYDTHNPINPINQEENEPLTELEEQQEWNQELLLKLKIAKIQLDKCIELAKQGSNTLLVTYLKNIKL